MIHELDGFLQVRAQNLLDLIYKRGQAGVTRASVTIVFDNSDKSSAPVGFENMAEISVTRQVSLFAPLLSRFSRAC
jgi:structural maintenance of chromosome 2